MQVVILCGGMGTRIREVSDNVVPKPLIPIGNQPIVWHIMKGYAAQGCNEFVLCLGHLSWKIKEYFLNQRIMSGDLSMTLGRSPQIEYHDPDPEEGWKVTLAETGAKTGTAGRIVRASKYLTGERFFLTYGDGVGDVDIQALEAFHRSHGKPLTLTGVIPPGRFGELSLEGDRIAQMQEKPTVSDRYINGGFMVMDRAFVEKYLRHASSDTMLERTPFTAAAAAGDMMIYKHNRFWQCMDTARDWEFLNSAWESGQAPWKIW